MKQPDPIELLHEKLEELKKALYKSHVSYSVDRSITLEQHEEHKKNLFPMIEKYKFAIEKIKR